MCGIAGYIGDRPLAEAREREALRLMHRRGPDHQEVERHASHGRHAVFLHSRLKIIDLDRRANQPFHCGEKSFIFNGELYNYLELASTLTAQGLTLRTRSDTEVFLLWLDRYGMEGLDQCEGMWAFGLFDERDGSLVLCRDRFGEKPLYYYKDDSGFYFGSEIKFIFALMGRKLPVNDDHIDRFLVNGYKALYKSGMQFFQGLEAVPAGAWLRLDRSGQLQECKRYWNPAYDQEREMTFDQAALSVREAMIDAMKIRLRSDVPLAFCMSGGVDSNTLISIAKRTFDYDVHGFTIVNSDERYAEIDLVEHAVAELGIRHTAIPVQTTDFIDNFRSLVRYHDAPVLTVTYYAQWLLERSIAEAGYKISISGTGADELFSGYYDHHGFYLHDIQNDAPLFETSLANWQTHIKPIVRNPYLQDPQRFVQNPAFRDHIFLDAQKFAEYLCNPWSEPFHENAYATSSLLRLRMLNELFHESVPVILHEDDLNAMYFSIENRSPFLDRKLFETALEIPIRHMIRNGSAKAVLRESMRGIVPDRILDSRRKVGFNAPLFSFLDRKDPATRRWLLSDSEIFNHVKRDRIEKFLDRDQLPNSESKFLFYFISVKMFLEEVA
ncbi:MAG: asparagine synthase (glutamine-hydrolyzing) [Magnetococcales bacterium]|nr:asparagine synthase (glutamine-hydrolyzing) [Magnetococcales bacterium]MBF0321486.1 asparagine synthase (glutamine-hydrolyzing) [Magnetococcales bacterium]